MTDVDFNNFPLFAKGVGGDCGIIKFTTSEHSELTVREV